MQNPEKKYTEEDKKLGVKIFYDIILPYYIEKRGTHITSEEGRNLNIFYTQIQEEIIDYIKNGNNIEKILIDCDRVLNIVAKNKNSKNHAKRIMNIFLQGGKNLK